MTKSDITREVNNLRDSGCLVFTFNHHKKMPRGAVGFVDHLIVTPNGYVFFLEDKLGKDKLSEPQREVATFLVHVGERYQYINYFTVDERTASGIFRFIYKTLKQAVTA